MENRPWKRFPGDGFQTVKGIAGTPVVLKIRRPGEEKALTFTLQRQQLVVTAPKEIKQ